MARRIVSKFVSQFTDSIVGWIVAGVFTAVIALTPRLVEAVAQLPLWSQVLLGLAATCFLVVAFRLRSQIWTSVKSWFRDETEVRGTGISQTFVAVGPGGRVDNLRASGNTMAIVQSAPVPPIADSASDSEIKQECNDLSQQVYGLYGAYYAAERARSTETFSSQRRIWMGAASEREKHEERERLSALEDELRDKATTDLMNTYNLQFMGIALALAERLEARNWISATERFHFEHPTNPLGIEAIARTLAKSAARP